jgi:hypothetical protein
VGRVAGGGRCCRVRVGSPLSRNEGRRSGRWLPPSREEGGGLDGDRRAVAMLLPPPHARTWRGGQVGGQEGGSGEQGECEREGEGSAVRIA